MAKLKEESKRCHRPRAYNRLKGPIPIAFHQSHTCNKLVPSHKAAAALERISSLTEGHMQAHTGQQTPNELFLLLYSHSAVFMRRSASFRLFLSLILPQTIVQTHPEGRCSGCDCRVPPAYSLALLNYTLLNNQAFQLY